MQSLDSSRLAKHCIRPLWETLNIFVVVFFCSNKLNEKPATNKKNDDCRNIIVQSLSPVATHDSKFTKWNEVFFCPVNQNSTDKQFLESGKSIVVDENIARTITKKRNEKKTA